MHLYSRTKSKKAIVTKEVSITLHYKKWKSSNQRRSEEY